MRLPNPLERYTSNGVRYIQGYVQVWHNGRWGSICDDGLDNMSRGKNLAKVLCKMAGYPDGDYSKSYTSGVAELGDHIWLDDVSSCT